MTKKKTIVVTVDDHALKDIKDLATRLSSKGMEVDRVMPITGVITGSCDAGKMSKLRGLEGVFSVEEEVGIQLPDPGSDIQ